MTPPTLSVIIISYNTRGMTLDCLRALHDQPSDVLTEVIVVDNASRDGSPPAIAEAFPTVRLVASETNLGFGAANNLAMRMAAGRYFLLLNSDAFPHAGCLNALVRYLDEHPEAGVVAPRLVNADSSLQRSCWPFPTPWRSWLEGLGLAALLVRFTAFDDYRHWPHNVEREVDFAIGACLLVRREAYEKAGGFDEQFFMYQEETDWQLRIKRAGWSVVFTPAGTATHLGGASGKDEPTKINRVFYESMDRYSLKHHGGVGFVVTRVAQVVGASLRMIGWGLLSVLPGRRAQAVREMQTQSAFLCRHLSRGLPS